MKTVTLNGVNFEVKNSRKYPVTVDRVNRYMEQFTGKDLSDFYNRPSDIKKAIYEDWLRWVRTSGGNASRLEVLSANCMQFTLSAIWCDDNGYIQYLLHITRDHNYAYPVQTN